MIRAVTLDFWNTLFVDRRGREREQMRARILRAELAAVRIETTDAALLDALAAGFDYFDQVWLREQRTPLCAEIVDATLASLHADLPSMARRRISDEFAGLLLRAAPDPVPGALRTVAYLADTYRVALISDTGYSPGRVLREVLRAHGLLERFAYLYFSDEGGRAKPHPEVFRQVLAELDVRAPEAVHVGDIQRTDIAGAQAAGMWAIHYIGASDRDARTSSADGMTRSFEEVPRIIGDLTCAGCDPGPFRERA